MCLFSSFKFDIKKYKSGKSVKNATNSNAYNSIQKHEFAKLRAVRAHVPLAYKNTCRSCPRALRACVP